MTGRLFGLCVLALFGCSGLIAPVAAQMVNPQVLQGAAQFEQLGQTLQITNSNGAIIHWDSFSVGADQIAHFAQPSADSQVLNRVVGSDPSRILGQLLSNGRVFLINPNGIVFGPDSQVHVAGLVASTLPLADADFLAGRFDFDPVAVSGAGLADLVQQGTILTGAAGEVLLRSAFVQQQGLIEAHAVRIEGGEVQLSGTVQALPGAQGQGGDIVVTAQGVALLDSARLLADGPQGGGQIRVGGGWTGQDPSVTNAQFSWVAPGALLTANALEQGAGGTIVVWANEATLARGRLQARGATPGLGGRIETSAAGVLQVDQAPDAGEGGLWLLDPVDVEIVSTSTQNITNNLVGGVRTLTPLFDILGLNPSRISVSTITSALNAGTSVTVTTTPTLGLLGTDPGNITVSTPIAVTGSSSATLRLQAHNDILINQSISSSGAQLGLVLVSDSDSNGTGEVRLASGTVLENVRLGADADLVLEGPNTGVAELKSVALSRNTTFDGNLRLSAGALTIPSGVQLTLAGSMEFASGSLAGAGTLFNDGVTTTLDTGLVSTGGALALIQDGDEGTFSLRGDSVWRRIEVRDGALSLANAGVSTAALQLQGGELRIGEGANLTLTGESTWSGGQLTLNDPSARLTVQALLTVLANAGDLAASNPESQIVVESSAGCLRLQGGTLSGDVPILVRSGGLLQGTGEIDGAVTLQGGRLEVGAAVGTLQLNDSLSVDSSSSVALDIGGLAAGSSDLLRFSGSPSLGGTLRIGALNNYLPSVGDQFQALAFEDGYTGTFANVVLPSGWTLTPSYSSTGLTLSTQSIIPGVQFTAPLTTVLDRQLLQDLLGLDDAVLDALLEDSAVTRDELESLVGPTC